MLVVRDLVLGLRGKGLVARPGCNRGGVGRGVGCCREASVRRHQKLPPSQTESVAADSEMDLLLAKARHISNLTAEKVDVP